MSELDEKTENGSVESAGKGGTEEKKAKDNSGLGLGVIFFLVAFVVVFLSGWLLFPKLLYSEKEQPFNFNHDLHVYEMGSCEACHFLREDGSFSGIPDLYSCTQCHYEEPMGMTEDEKIFCEEYVAKGKEVPWLVYSKQPDNVFFSHAAHTEGAGMECKTCHGSIGQSKELPTYEENRLTGYSRDIWGDNIWGIDKNSRDSMKMDDCAECHEEETGSKGACFQCHK
ncbi:MAG: cytochrome c family protein [Desulfarculaceae bacterium]|nr:cytochrome c family protein [Desulfarculaceae bacterium]